MGQYTGKLFFKMVDHRPYKGVLSLVVERLLDLTVRGAVAVARVFVQADLRVVPAASDVDCEFLVHTYRQLLELLLRQVSIIRRALPEDETVAELGLLADAAAEAPRVVGVEILR